VLCEALNVQETDDVGFFLTILESNVSYRDLRSTYDVRSLKKLMTKEQKSKAPLDIMHSIKGCKVLDLVRVSNKNLCSKHVYICISGFMTEAVSKTEEWMNV
jgi:hypothetical protein